MPAVTKVPIISGFALPFYPMRPHTAKFLLTPDEALQVAEERAKTHVLQPKLNGDRGELGIGADGQVHVANRHGRYYSLKLTNKAKYAPLGPGTLLDGEIWKGEFLPFEAIAVSGTNHMFDCPTIRIAKAKQICADLNLEWLFEPIQPGSDYLRRHLNNGKDWEGFVGKKLKSAYIAQGSETAESTMWFKSKWIK